MALYDPFDAGLTHPNGGCQASVEAQTKDFETALAACSSGKPVGPLTQADLRELTGCRWCEASVEGPAHSAVQIQRPQGQPLGHGGELAAAADACGAGIVMYQGSPRVRTPRFFLKASPPGFDKPGRGTYVLSSLQRDIYSLSVSIPSFRFPMPV